MDKYRWQDILDCESVSGDSELSDCVQEIKELCSKLDNAVQKLASFIDDAEFHNFRGGESFLNCRVNEVKSWLVEAGYQVGKTEGATNE